MASSSSASLSPALHDVFTRCIALYRSLAFSLLQPNLSASSPSENEVEEDRLLDEFGRLKIWGEQTKASLQPSTRGSLDDFLRTENRLNEEVKGILLQLEALLDSAISTANQAKNDRPNDLSEDGHSSDLLVSDSDYSSQSGAEDDGQEDTLPRPKVSRLSMTLSHIFDQIQLLYHLASLLRRPGLKGRYLRRGNWEETAETFDLRHVEEKLRQWEREAADESGHAQEDIVVSPDVIQARTASSSESSPHAVLSRRFAKANLQRREQLKYWARHPYSKPKRQLTHEPKLAILSEQVPTQDTPVVQQELWESREEEEASTLKQPSSRHVTENTHQTAYTFSTVADSAVSDEIVDAPRPKTIYAESLVAGKRPARVPPPPIPKLSSRFECPYCHMDLDAAIMQDRQMWKHHVFRDLRPYSCTFTECHNPDKLYSTRHDWIYHEMQMHRRQWVCHECEQKEPFESRDLFARHLNNFHSKSWSQRQIPVIIDMGERPIAESVILPCSLCSSELSLAKLLPHIAGHLEEISLFSLPVLFEEEDDADSNKGVARVVSQTEGSHLEEHSSLSSLRFSDRPLSERGERDLLVDDMASAPSFPGDRSPSVDTTASETIDPRLLMPIGKPSRSTPDNHNSEAIETGSNTMGKNHPASASSDKASVGQDALTQIDVNPETRDNGDNEFDVDKIIQYVYEVTRLRIREQTDGLQARAKSSALPLMVLSVSDVNRLITEATRIFLAQPSLLELEAPVKIFGELSGSVHILMRYFKHQGSLSQTRYLFLGGYTSTESIYSFDTVMLLLAYKVKYPNSLFLLRGEDLTGPSFELSRSYIEAFLRDLTALTGTSLGTEISNSASWILSSLEYCFQSLPIAAIIGSRIFATHHGLSRNPDILQHIRQLKRPFRVERSTLDPVLLALFNSKFDEGVHPGGFLDVFGPEDILKFLAHHRFQYVCTSLAPGAAQFWQRQSSSSLARRYIGVYGVAGDQQRARRQEYSTTLSVHEDLRCYEQRWECWGNYTDNSVMGPLPGSNLVAYHAEWNPRDAEVLRSRR